MSRRAAAITMAAGGVLFWLLAWRFVPWSPVPGGVPAPAPVDSVFTPDQIRLAEQYARGARLLGWASLLVSLVVAGWLGFTDAGRRLVGRVRGPWWWRVLVVVVAVRVLCRLATLPFAVSSRQRARSYGLSNQSWPGYARDLAVGEVVLVIGTALAVLVLVGAARRWPRTWPAVAGSVLAGLVLLTTFLYPLLVEPLFNRFTPLPDAELRSSILRLAASEGVEVRRVLVADASRRTTTLNAYVSGFGDSRRVVVYDTLLQSASDPEVLAVVAHELAHARHDDVLVGAALGAAGTLAGVGLLALVVEGSQRGPSRRRGRSVAHPEAIPLVLALVAVATLAASPVQNGISRQFETRADVEALAATADPAAFIDLQRRLALRALSDPTPPAWSQFWFGTHPTALTRIAIARQSGT